MSKKVVIIACICLAIVLGVCGLYFFRKPTTSQLTPNHSTTTTQKPVSATPPPAPDTGGMWHAGVISTVFWVGEGASSENGHISNVPSAWDEQWTTHFGGTDTPDARNGFNPKAFTPRENPFYVALPYNDIDNAGRIKPQRLCAAFSPQPTAQQQCKNTWVQITYQDKTVYAQWEDVGPFAEDDTPYVFGTAAPANTEDSRAGIDVSPAVRDYLGLQDVDTVSWRFVTPEAVPSGRWKVITTTSTY